MKQFKILVVIPFNELQRKKLTAAMPEAEFIFKSKAEISQQEVSEADIIMGNVPELMLCHAERLQWLQLNSAGANPYCNPGVLKENVQLTCASGAYGITVSENMVAYTMALFKNLYAYHDFQKVHRWEDKGPALSAYGACVLILGLGDIGLAYARRMKAMGSYIIGIRRHMSEKPEAVDEVYTMEALEACLVRADVVAVTLPGTEETCHVIGRRQLEIMKESAYLINVGRGNCVDNEALAEAMAAQEIAGAVLDVTEPEPLPYAHPLWETPGVYITPHVAGGFHIPVTLDIISDICAENLKNFHEGKSLSHIINKRKGY